MTQQLLETREQAHGDYRKVASVAQSLKRTVRDGVLDVPQQEALEMICVKIARIVCGNADFIDHWVDIAGYAQLIVNDLEKKKKVETGILDLSHLKKYEAGGRE